MSAESSANHPWLRSLAGRITMVTAAVAILAVLVTGLAAFPLIRTAAVGVARQQLSRQADAYAVAPAASRTLDLRERQLLGPDTYELSKISAAGTVTGVAAPLLSSAEVGRILSGEPFSGTFTRDGTRVLVEARALKRGGAVVLTRSLADVDAASAQILQRMLLALALGLLIATVAGTLLSRRLSRPLAHTAAAARRIAGGERTVALEPSGATEVRAVGEAVNILDAALLASEARQREFLLSISHEIRTPLTAVRGYAEAMADGLIPSDEVARVGQVLAGETERLDRFVQDLLTLARLEAEDFVLDIRLVDITAILREVEAAWQGAAVTTGARLRLELPAGESPTGESPTGAEPLLVDTDGQRLRQILDGLVGNALRVTPAGRPLVLRAGREHADVSAGAADGEPDVVIDVQDSGPGLTAEDAAVAFDRGVLYRRYAGRRPVGSGLGLSIAARLAQRLGLRLTVEPTTDDGGTCFRVRLPSSSTQRLLSGFDPPSRG